MAKVKKITADTEINISPSSKACTYEIDSSEVVTVKMNTLISKKQAKTYTSFENFAIQRGDDLVIDTLFVSKSNTIKVVSTTVKGYFAETVEHVFSYQFMSSSSVEVPLKPSYKSVITPDLPLCREVLDDSVYTWIAGTSSSDTFSLGNNSASIVYDKKGDDTYDTHITMGHMSGIFDLNGSDIYNAYGKGRLTITDEKGNDIYTSNGRMIVEDVNGNDKYSVVGTTNENKINDHSGKDEYMINQSSDIEIIDEGKGNDTYTVTNCTGVKYWINDEEENLSYFTISDEKGNETYDVLNLVFNDENFDPDKSEYAIEDKSGNDNYKLKGCGNFRALDEKGNDTILIQNSENLYFTDNSGNDKWTLNRTDNLHALDEIYVTDEKGNDKYTITGVRNVDGTGGYASITDKAGNDNYTMNGKSDGVILYDETGNDKYDISDGSKNFAISDHGGKDNYKLTGESDNRITTACIYDGGQTNDKYTLSWVDNYNTIANAIYDDGGKDIYNLTNCRSVKIEDNSGNDKYNIKADANITSSVAIIDNSGKDTYNLKGTQDKMTKATTWLFQPSIIDKGSEADTYNFEYAHRFNIADFDGNKDKYNLKSSYGNITDYENGNDSYKVSGMVAKTGTYIDDRGGKDSLTLSDVKKNDIVVMANVVGDGGCDDGSLILLNKSNNSFVCVSNYFTTGNDDKLNGLGDGTIESMKAGKKSIAVDYNYLNSVIQEASSYLSTGDTVLDALRDQDEATIANLIACFTQG